VSARIPTPEVSDSSFGEFEAAQAVLERPADKARAVGHYTALAAEAALATFRRGPQHQIQIPRGTPVVGVPYRGEVFDVACDVAPADERHPHDGYTIFAVKLNGVWIGADWLEHLATELQRTLDKMPRNT
jgi:hypothetical protein